ncbi:MAG: acyl-CoA thioesterase [Planctomycetes bacterium]|nr:acyl-CoA thioesterase [Planctomycetota bacterium]
MPSEHRYRRRVEFAETDMAGIAHFSALLRYAEEAEHDFYRSLGLSVHPREGGGEGSIGFPRVASRCEFMGPARFEDVLEIQIWVRRKGPRSLTYQFTVSRDGAPVARGEMAVACCRTGPGGSFAPAPLPQAFAERIEESPRPPLELRS